MLAELIGAPTLSNAADVSDAPTDPPAAQDDLEALLAASEVADDALFEMETVFFQMHAEIDIIGHVALSERQVSQEVWCRIEDHLDLALDTLEDTWTLAQERRHALRDALKTEQAKRQLLERTGNADAQPGSTADVDQAEATWTMLRTMARLALEHCDKAQPAAA